MVALIFSFVNCVLILPLEMIDDLVFHDKGFQPAGLYTALGLVVVDVIIFCFCTLCPRFGMRGKRWKELQDRLKVMQTETDHSTQTAGAAAMPASGRMLRKSDNDTAKQVGGALELAGAVSAVSTASAVLSETQTNAESMACAYGVPVPDIKKQLIAFAVLPIFILIGVYIPQYIEANREMQENIAFSAEQINVLKTALSPICEYVYADDPTENYHDYGYHVTGYLRESGIGIQKSYVCIDLDESGVITSVSYREELDINSSLKENLDRIETDFEALQAPLGNLNVPVSAPELLTLHKLPDRFKEAFLSGTLYENISIYEDDPKIRISCYFDTDTEEDFDEYSEPSICLYLWVN